jgi:hypothetical protein
MKPTIRIKERTEQEYLFIIDNDGVCFNQRFKLLEGVAYIEFLKKGNILPLGKLHSKISGIDPNKVIIYPEYVGIDEDTKEKFTIEMTKEESHFIVCSELNNGIAAVALISY